MNIIKERVTFAVWTQVSHDKMFIQLFDTLIVFLKESFENVDLKKKKSEDSQKEKNRENFPACKELQLQVTTASSIRDI